MDSLNAAIDRLSRYNNMFAVENRSVYPGEVFSFWCEKHQKICWSNECDGHTDSVAHHGADNAPIAAHFDRYYEEEVW